MRVFIAIIDSKGALAFQEFTRDRWERLSAFYNTLDTKNVMMFKIALTGEEMYAIKWMIKLKRHMAAAMELTAIRCQRGDA